MEAPKKDDILFFHAKDPELGVDLAVKLKVLEYPTGTNYKSVRAVVEDVLKGDDYAVGDEDIFDLQYLSPTESPLTRSNDVMFHFVENMEKTNSLPPAPKEFLAPLAEEPVPATAPSNASAVKTPEAPPVPQGGRRRKTPRSKKPSRRTTKSKRSKSAPRKK